MGDRHSRELGDGQAEVVSDEERAPREAKNAYEQVRRLEELIADAVLADHFKLRPSTLMELNRIAIEGLVTAPGRYRLSGMEIPGSKHQPPLPSEVPALVDELCDYVNDHWERSAVHLAAYVMWRLNWIHPFQDGNGRTSRASSYLVLCGRLGHDLPGKETVPDHIAGNKEPYYSALEAADKAHDKGQLDLSELEKLLEQTVIKQVRDAATSTDGARPKRAISASKSLASLPSTALAVRRETTFSKHAGSWIAAGATVLVALLGLAATCMGSG